MTHDRVTPACALELLAELGASPRLAPAPTPRCATTELAAQLMLAS